MVELRQGRRVSGQEESCRRQQCGCRFRARDYEYKSVGCELLKGYRLQRISDGKFQCSRYIAQLTEPADSDFLIIASMKSGRVVPRSNLFRTFCRDNSLFSASLVLKLRGTVIMSNGPIHESRLLEFKNAIFLILLKMMSTQG